MQAIIASESAMQRERLRQAVLGVGLLCGASDCVSFRELPGRLLHAPADLVLLGVGLDPTQGLTVIECAAAQTRAPIFAVGRVLDSNQILQVLRAGAREYLDEDNLRDELLADLKKLRQTSAAPLRWGMLTAVTSATPGSGVTTVASNLAFALAARFPNDVVLAEVHDGAPELSLNLDLRPRHALSDLASRVDQLDSILLRNALLEHSAKLSVLADLPENLGGADWQPHSVKQLLALIRTQFRCAVFDLGHTPDAARREALEASDKLILVVRLDVPSIRLNRTLYQQLSDFGIDGDKLHVVVNRFGQRCQFPWKKAATALGLPIQDWIPDDSARVNHALNEGKPLLQTARRAAITRCFDQLADRLTARLKSRAG
jgi:pilus assembly protein CpaE